VSPHRGDAQPHIVNGEADSGNHGRCEPATLVLWKPAKVRSEDRRGDESSDVVWVGWTLLQPASNLGEPRLLQAALGVLRCDKDPRRPAEELRGTCKRDCIDDLANTPDIANTAALDLEHTARAQRLCQPLSKPLMIGHPVERRRREHHIDQLAQLKVKDILTPHLGATLEPLAGECHHLLRRVYRPYPAVWDERQQRLRNAAGTAADVQDRRVMSDAVEPLQYLRSPRLLRLARPVVCGRIPTSAHHVGNRTAPKPADRLAVRSPRERSGQRRTPQAFHVKRRAKSAFRVNDASKAFLA
jgi:hypothetical protein